MSVRGCKSYKGKYLVFTVNTVTCGNFYQRTGHV